MKRILSSTFCPSIIGHVPFGRWVRGARLRIEKCSTCLDPPQEIYTLSRTRSDVQFARDVVGPAELRLPGSTASRSAQAQRDEDDPKANNDQDPVDDSVPLGA